MASIVNPEKFSPLRPDFQFGIDPAGIAQQLREIASAIDAGDVCVQKATVYHSMNFEEFKMAGVVLQFVEKFEDKRVHKALYTAGSTFPVEVSPKS
jgi:hypothetical protein